MGEGASGGVLVDAKGDVVGVIHEGNADNPHEEVAVPVDRVRVLLAKAKAEPKEL